MLSSFTRRIVLFLLLSAIGPAAAMAKTTKDLLSESRSKGDLTWKMAETASPAEDVGYLAGALPNENEKEGVELSFRVQRDSETQGPPLPSSFSWGRVDGRSFLPATRDQGYCGSCVSFAAVDTFEIQLNIARNISRPEGATAFSRQFLFSCAGGVCRRGMQMDAAVRMLQETGVPEEPCLPYLSGSWGEDIACGVQCTAENLLFKISSVDKPTDGIIDIVKMKRALLRGPLLSSMILFEDLLYYKSGVYRHVAGPQLGSHAVTVVGWDDAVSAWIVRNSWGPEWGEEGTFRIAYDDQASLLGRYTWSFYVDPDQSGRVVIDSPSNSGSVRGTVPLAFGSTLSGSSRVEWVIAKNLADIEADRVVLRGEVANERTGRNESGGGLGGGQAMTSFDSRSLADGKYVMVARQYHAAGVKVSSPRELAVMNGAFRGAISLTNVLNGAVLKGVKNLVVSVSAAPVPFDRLSLLIKNQTSGQVVERTIYNIGEKIMLRWATQAFEDGEYLVSFKGVAGSTTVESEPVAVQIDNN